ncbi:DUF6207 family protein [Streptomyces microflavus]
MDSVIDARHVSEPGLVVLDVTAADKGDRPALVDGLQQLWATSGITTTPLRPAPAPGCTRTSGAPTPAAQLASLRTGRNRPRQRTTELEWVMSGNGECGGAPSCSADGYCAKMSA